MCCWRAEASLRIFLLRIAKGLINIACLKKQEDIPGDLAAVWQLTNSQSIRLIPACSRDV